MDSECCCADYELGRRDLRQDRQISPYLVYRLHHSACYYAGRHDERLEQLDVARRGASARR